MTFLDDTASVNHGVDLPVNRVELAAFIDLVVTSPERTADEVRDVVARADEWGLNACYVPSSCVPQPQAQVPVGALVNYPWGTDCSLAKAFAARLAVDQGASEICAVSHLGTIVAGDWNALMADMVTVREAVPSPVILQFVVDTRYLLTLPDGAERLARCCRIAATVGVDMVVASTGLHMAGGASPKSAQLVPAVQIMAETVGGKLGIKAMGGVDSAECALAAMAAGATQLGCTETEVEAVLAGMPAL